MSGIQSFLSCRTDQVAIWRDFSESPTASKAASPIASQYRIGGGARESTARCVSVGGAALSAAEFIAIPSHLSLPLLDVRRRNYLREIGLIQRLR
jgi:hypothetical protein